MWTIIQDGFYVINQYFFGISIFLLCAFGLGFALIKHVTNNQDVKFIFLASFGAGLIYLSLISYVLVVLAHYFPSVLKTGSLAICFLIIVFLLKSLWSNNFKYSFDLSFILVAVGAFLLLLARLAFLRHLLMPPYSDSPIHYQIIRGFLDPGEAYRSKLSLDNILTNYYHFGFHSLAAWFISATNIDPLIAMPLIGQLVLTLGGFSIIALTYSITNNFGLALFAGLLGAAGWLMPSFSANWGKFPALIAIAISPTLLAIPRLYSQKDGDKKITFLLFGAGLVAGIVLIHTRIIICLLLALGCYFLAQKIRPKESVGFFQALRLSLLFAVSLLPLRELLGHFYFAISTWIILLFLLPFAFQEYTSTSLGIFLYVFGLWVVTLAPKLLKLGIQPLLDAQFVEMALYIPFSILGGIGFSALLKRLEARKVGQAFSLTFCAETNVGGLKTHRHQAKGGTSWAN